MSIRQTVLPTLTVAAVVLVLGGFTHAGTVLHYSFDADYTDSSGSGNHGTVYGSGGRTTSRSAFGGAAYEGQGTDGGVDLTTPIVFSASDKWSVSVWAQTDNIAGNTNMILGDRTDNADFIWTNNGFDGFRFRSSNSTTYDFTSPKDNNLHHYAVVADGTGSVSLYRDGAFDETVTLTNSSFTINAVGDAYGGLWMDGIIDEVWVFDDALNSTQVQSLYQNNVVPEPSTFLLAAIGLLGLTAWSRRRMRRSHPI